MNEYSINEQSFEERFEFCSFINSKMPIRISGKPYAIYAQPVGYLLHPINEPKRMTYDPYTGLELGGVIRKPCDDKPDSTVFFCNTLADTYADKHKSDTIKIKELEAEIEKLKEKQMNIQTKFNIGDTVYGIATRATYPEYAIGELSALRGHDSDVSAMPKICRFKIVKIETETTADGEGNKTEIIYYSAKDKLIRTPFVANTLEELLKLLVDMVIVEDLTRDGE